MCTKSLYSLKVIKVSANICDRLGSNDEVSLQRGQAVGGILSQRGYLQSGDL